mmetsp:Transcript_5008/g.15443  ORF Transcript_5008/g.15443 Transcript_5008/m.15443 type:complete len:278 (-) Transcript_5008:485-1318(-)
MVRRPGSDGHHSHVVWPGAMAAAAGAGAGGARPGLAAAVDRGVLPRLLGAGVRAAGRLLPRLRGPGALGVGRAASGGACLRALLSGAWGAGGVPLQLRRGLRASPGMQPLDVDRGHASGQPGAAQSLAVPPRDDAAVLAEAGGVAGQDGGDAADLGVVRRGCRLHRAMPLVVLLELPVHLLRVALKCCQPRPLGDAAANLRHHHLLQVVQALLRQPDALHVQVADQLDQHPGGNAASRVGQGMELQRELLRLVQVCLRRLLGERQVFDGHGGHVCSV